ncbi:MAG TPA: DNA-binding response regulator [Bacteroidales bacterium]|nr:DNA-binding response regulator [Bacteroidales bacterium]
MPIKVIIADDHKLFREGLSNLLTDAKNIEIISQAENGRQVLDQVRFKVPDVILMDIGMPILNGMETTLALRSDYPQIKVIALSMHADKTYVKGMIEAGAWGYLMKNCTYDQLVDAINQVYSGKKYLGADAAEVIIQDYLDHETRGISKPAELTERESEILKLLAEGQSIREIADKLFISIKTVGTHKQNIFDKLGFENTAQLVKYALKNGIISF